MNRKQSNQPKKVAANSGDQENAAPGPHDALRAMAIKANDYDAVADALDGSASIAKNIWLTFISVGTYFVIVTWSVTHKQLFLETPIKLPLIDVSLPLYGFFIVAPIFFLAIHAYLLLQLVILVRRVRRYEAVVGRHPNNDVKAKLKEQITSAMLAQFLIAPFDYRKPLELMLAILMWLTIVIGPIFLFLLIEWRFLPFQDQIATCVHRAVVIMDLLLLCFLWPAIVNRVGAIGWPSVKQWSFALPPSLLIVFAAAGILTFPGDSAENLPGVAAFHDWATWQVPLGALEGPAAGPGVRGLARISGSDAELGADWLRRTPEARRWIQGTLRLADIDVYEDHKVDQVEGRTSSGWDQERSLTIAPGRRLSFADLSYADLRRADLRRLEIVGANLVYSRLDGSRLDGSNLSSAMMHKASLEETSLVNTNLTTAILVVADFASARMIGTNFAGAHLRGAKMKGVILSRVNLVAANLDYADLRGASLEDADFTAASLRSTRLQGAHMSGAKLVAADLEGAAAEGVNLVGAELQGASLFKTDLTGSIVNDANVYRTNIDDAKVLGASNVGVSTARRIGGDITSTVFHSEHGVFVQRVERSDRELTDEDVVRWTEVATKAVISDSRKNEITSRLGRLKKHSMNAEQDRAIQLFWIGNDFTVPDVDKYIDYVIDGVCQEDDLPYVLLRSAILNGVLSATPRPTTMADRLKTKEPCPARQAITATEWNVLEMQLAVVKAFTPPRAGGK